jgi:hypothetical protein
MSSADKLNILLSLSFLGLCFISLLVIMRTIGNIDHSIERLQDIITKEVKITYQKQIKNLRKQKQQESLKTDRARRQKALLNVPLMDNRPPPPAPPEG